MSNLQLQVIVATVQQLLSQTTALLQYDGSVIIQDEVLETLERDTRRAVRQLRRYRNCSPALPINRLPPELLCMIFGHIRKPPSIRCLRYIRGSRSTSYRDLISTMLVCHKWHAIASKAAVLWTDVDPYSAEALLARSSGATIRFSAFLPLIEEDTLEKIFENDGKRIYELNLSSVGAMPSLQSILATDMPHLQQMALSLEDTYRETLQSLLCTGVLGSFPTLRAMLLENILITTAHILPALTHLHLGQLWNVSISDILNVLTKSPTLRVFHITDCRDLIIPPQSAMTSSSISLQCLRDLDIRGLTTTAVHHLTGQLDAPALTFVSLSSILASNGTLASTSLIPNALRTWRINHLAVIMKPSAVHAAFLGDKGTLHVDIKIESESMPHEEKWTWLRNDLPTMLSLSGVEELHFQTRMWDAPASENLLAHLATYMPAVSKLVVQHYATYREHRFDTEAVTELGRILSEILTSDSPVLFPRLAELGLVVSDVPLELCEHVARGLARRNQDGRRLQKLRIRVGGDHLSEWQIRWKSQPDLAWEDTGVFDHVDSGELYPKERGTRTRYEDDLYHSEDATTRMTLRWGKWKDCVGRTKHEYWED